MRTSVFDTIVSHFRYSSRGESDEVDIDTWRQQFMVEASAPEDWSGSVDMDPEDYAGTASNEMPAGFHDPLDFMKE